VSTLQHQCAAVGEHLDGLRQRRRSILASILHCKGRCRLVLHYHHYPRRPVSGTPILPLTSPAPPLAPAQPPSRPSHLINQPAGKCIAPSQQLGTSEPSLVSSNQSTQALLTTPTPPGRDRLCDHLLLLCCLPASVTRSTAAAHPAPPLDVSPSYNLHLAPGSNFRELDLPNLDAPPARLHPGTRWLGTHLLCALSPATDHRLSINSRLLVPRPDGHVPEAPPFHHKDLAGAKLPITLELIRGLHVDCSHLPG